MGRGATEGEEVMEASPCAHDRLYDEVWHNWPPAGSFPKLSPATREQEQTEEGPSDETKVDPQVGAVSLQGPA